jgi:1,4-dihydroxy-2-naphthoate octaprenyltransferase
LGAPSLVLSGLPALIAMAAVRAVGDVDRPVAAEALVAVLAFHAAGNLLNEYFDRRIRRGSAGGRAAAAAEPSSAEVLCLGCVCLAAAAAATGLLAAATTPAVLWFAGCAGAVVYAYAGPPFALRGRALGESVVFVTFGPVLMLGVSLAAGGRLCVEVLVLSLPVGAAVAAVAAAGNLRDLEDDGRAGIRTLPVLLGQGTAVGLYVSLLVSALAGTAAVGLLVPPARVLLAAPLLGVLSFPTITRMFAGERLARAEARTARLAAALFGLVLLVLLVSGPVAGAAG